MVETVRVSATSSRSGLIRSAGDRLVRAAKEGDSLGPHFIAESAFPAAFSRSYATGEEAGTLDTDMANWSHKFQEAAVSAMKTAAVMVPKVLYFIIMAYVAWKIIGFFSGYYSELDRIGD
jgi:type II secretory pathway component PulF